MDSICFFDGFKSGDFLCGEVVGHISGNYYSLLVDNGIRLSAYCAGRRLKKGKYIFKLVSGGGFRGISLELLYSSNEGENISYIIGKFAGLSLLSDRGLVIRIVGLYLKYNLRIEEADIVRLYRLVNVCVEFYGSGCFRGCFIDDLLVMRSKGISFVKMFLYIRDIVSMEGGFSFGGGDNFLSLGDIVVVEDIDIGGIFRSFSCFVLGGGVYSFDNVVFVEASSFCKASLGGRDFCFFSLPCSLRGGTLGFFLIKLFFRGVGGYSIHFSLSLKSYGWVRGVVFSSGNRFSCRVFRQVGEGFSIVGSFRVDKDMGGDMGEDILEKSVVLSKRTVNENKQSAEEMINMAYGFVNYGRDCMGHKIPSIVYLLLAEMVYAVVLFLRGEGYIGGGDNFLSLGDIVVVEDIDIGGIFYIFCVLLR